MESGLLVLSQEFIPRLAMSLSPMRQVLNECLLTGRDVNVLYLLGVKYSSGYIPQVGLLDQIVDLFLIF